MRGLAKKISFAVVRGVLTWIVIQVLSVTGIAAIIITAAVSTTALVRFEVLQELAPHWQAAFVVGLLLLSWRLPGLSLGLSRWWGRRAVRRRRKAARAARRGRAVSAPTTGDRVTFYADGRALPSLAAEMERFDEVWALWYTGGRANGHDVWGVGRIKRLILLSPQGEYLPRLASAFLQELQDVRPIIEGATRRAQQAGVEVRWFDGPIPMELTVGNPGEATGQVRVEVPLPSATVEDRPSFIVEKARHGELFGKLVEQYEMVWSQSGEPPEKEAKEASEILAAASAPGPAVPRRPRAPRRR